MHMLLSNTFVRYLEFRGFAFEHTQSITLDVFRKIIMKETTITDRANLPSYTTKDYTQGSTCCVCQQRQHQKAKSMTATAHAELPSAIKTLIRLVTSYQRTCHVTVMQLVM